MLVISLFIYINFIIAKTTFQYIININKFGACTRSNTYLPALGSEIDKTSYDKLWK